MFESARRPESFAPTTERLLLIDPVEASRTSMARRLTALGFEVETAEDGVEGAATALRNPPAAVIADLWMPGVSGIQLCRLLRAEPATSTTPVILRGDEDDRRNRFWAEHAGAHALVGKGRLGEVVRLLRRALAAAPARDDFFLQVASGSAIRDRIAKHLDAALFESVIASEVRAFASCDSTIRLFDLLSQLVSQIHAYRWLAVSSPATGFVGVHHRAGEGPTALLEARLALGAEDAEVFVLEDEDAAGGEEAGMPILQTVTFGDRELGTIALAPSAGRRAEAVELTRIVARELGGALRMTSLVEETRKLASTDPLTHLMNRRAFVGWAETEIARCARHGTPLGIAILDVDHFKLVNDWFGHGNGDRVLVEVARTMRSVLRTGDAAARWGGEEMLIALPGASIEGALAAAERVRVAVAGGATTVEGAPPITVTASLGVATLQPGESLASVVERADAALYAAKKAGRNQVVSAERVEVAIATPDRRSSSPSSPIAVLAARAPTVRPRVDTAPPSPLRRSS